MKKFFAALLTAVLVSAFIPVVYADEVAMPLPLEIYGTIVSETENSITVEDDLTGETIVLNINEDTYIVDGVTGAAVLVKDRTGDRVGAFYGPATTMSLPAQSNAVAIALNLPENNRSAKYVVVEAIVVEENAVKITTNNGGLIITVSNENPIMPYLTRNIVTLEHIEVGTQLMVWYDIVAMSYPGQTTSNRTVVFGKKLGTGGSATVFTNAGVAVINGEEINLDPAPFVNDEGVLLLPMRLMCEALGCEVSWVEGTSKVKIAKDGTTFIIEFGSKSYEIEGDTSGIRNFSFEDAPVVDSATNRTFVSAGFFRTLMDIEIVVNDSEM